MVAGGQRIYRVGICLLVAGTEAGMVHQEVLELVTVGVQARLLAEAGRCEEWKGLKSSKGSLALGNSRGRTGDWNMVDIMENGNKSLAKLEKHPTNSILEQLKLFPQSNYNNYNSVKCILVLCAECILYKL